MDNQVFEEVDQYISSLLAPEDEALATVVHRHDEAGIGNMSISPVQGKMLQMLAKACNAKKILELGTFGGYSTIWLARALPEDGKVISLEYDPAYAEMARKNIAEAGLAHKIEIRVGAAMDTLPMLADEGEAPFDLIFIDADKPPYTEYFQWALKLSRPGSIIIADNVIRNAQVLDVHSHDEKVQGVQRFNKYLAGCKEVTATILQTVGAKEYDGMAIAVVNHK